jgi:hypothetical protein
VWIHYMSHELVGLSDSEMDTYYPHIDKKTRALLTGTDSN